MGKETSQKEKKGFGRRMRSQMRIASYQSTDSELSVGGVGEVGCGGKGVQWGSDDTLMWYVTRFWLYIIKFSHHLHLWNNIFS